MRTGNDNRKDPEPARISYEPWRGMLTGLVRGGPMPSWAVPQFGVAWDTPGAWWLDCLVTYESDRIEGLILAVVPTAGADLLKEAAQILGRWCVTEAIVCHVQAPMSNEMILWIREYNARLVKDVRARQASPAGARPRPAGARPSAAGAQL